MVRCNREIIKTITSDIDPVDSNLDDDIVHCNNILENPDMIDFLTTKDQMHFYEKTNLKPCDDLWLISNEECLWQAIVGEIKTPYGDLSNSIGQADYGCKIWSLIGEPLDSLVVKEYESYIVETCLKYPEVNNVLKIETKIGERDSVLSFITIDSIYGTFDGVTHIPMALPTEKDWRPAKDVLVSY